MDELNKELFNDLSRAFMRFKRIRPHLAPPDLGVTSGQFSFLRVLEHLQFSPHSAHTEEGVKVSSLAKAMDQAPPYISKRIDELEHLGLVMRTRSKNDRRVTYVSFTKKGEELMNTARKSFDDYQYTVIARMGEENAREFLKYLNLFIDASHETSAEAREGHMRKHTKGEQE